MSNYTIILPVLNEKDNILKLIIELEKIFINCNYEIIVVDDSSTDGTTQLLNDLKVKKNFFKHILRNKKKNLVDSLNEGISEAKFNKIIWMDCDFSHPPKSLKKIFNYVDKYKMISFSRFNKNSKRYFELDHNQNKYFIDNLSFFLNKICNVFLYSNFSDYTSGFICIEKNSLPNKLKGYYGDYYIELVCHVIRNNISFIELPYEELPRHAGYSKTTSNKIKLLINCYFYFYRFLLNLIKKLK